MSSLADVRQALMAALEQAERELREQTNTAQRRGEAQARRAIAQTTQCAIELEAQIEQLAAQLEETRTSLVHIRERLADELRSLREEPLIEEQAADETLGEPIAEAGPEPRHEDAAEPEPAAAGVSTDDTVRVLRAALDALSRQKNGGV